LSSGSRAFVTAFCSHKNHETETSERHGRAVRLPLGNTVGAFRELRLRPTGLVRFDELLNVRLAEPEHIPNMKALQLAITNPFSYCLLADVKQTAYFFYAQHFQNPFIDCIRPGMLH
jgi:hypothetical protein